ncbi:MAG TPA: IucA/IucC family protein [Nocardioidaceae bacterium]|nr:IucA/IucC family protein [Nocardioidaceae bacterium]
MSVTTAPALDRLADQAHRDAVLRCWTREHGIPVTDDLDVAVPGTSERLLARVGHASRTGLHAFDDVRLRDTAGTTRAVDAVDLLGVLTTGADPVERAALLDRTRESVANLARFAARPAPDPVAEGAFLAGERSLLLGHRHHPAPKSRDHLDADDLDAWSPELTGRFRMHWFEAHVSVVGHGHVPSPCLDGHDVPSLLARVAGRPASPGHVLLPAHPWQASDLLRRPAVRRLVDAGLLKPLGPLGDAWWATSSLRTLYHPEHSVMLKLSLGLRITNSVREATATELRRGLEVHRLLDTGYVPALPHGFTVVRDPGWAAIADPADPSGGTLTGLDVTVREVPPGLERTTCLAGLIAPGAPDPDEPAGWRPSHLARRIGDDPAAWLAGYVDRVLVPMLHLYAVTGIGLEGHQQNTLVRLDRDGQVAGGAFRDNQGYYLAASRLGEVLDVTEQGESALAVVDDAVVDDRLTYYLLHNQTLALVGSMAAEGLVAEDRLLDVLRTRLAAARPGLADAGAAGARLVDRWLDAHTLPCKANLATRLSGIDEVVAPLDAQSVYLDVPNPLAVTR